jgi:2-isopropylmalate synthase
LASRFAELGFDLDKSELDEAYSRFTKLADKKKKIYDQDLIAIARRSPVAIAA